MKKELCFISIYLLKSEKNIENIGKVMNEVQQSINDLRNSVDLDSQDKAANIQAKQESLKSKVKESGVTLERTKIVSFFKWNLSHFNF